MTLENSINEIQKASLARSIENKRGFDEACEMFKKSNQEERRIVCAANQSLNKVNGVPYLVIGIRHFDNNMREQIKYFFGEEYCKNKYWEQGFVDNKGQFHNRKEALKIARAADQIIKKTGPEDQLFSEDLY